MSLTSFIKQPEIATKLQRLHSGLLRQRNTNQRAHEDGHQSLIVLNDQTYRVVRRLDTWCGLADGSDWRILTADGERIPIKVEPLSKHYPLIGTAFDYLLRFELQRRAPHAILRPWVAEEAVDRSAGTVTEEWRNSQFCITLAPNEYPPEGAIPADDDGKVWIDGDKVTRHISAVLKNAKSAVASYSRKKRPTATEQATLAAHAIRLAKLDTVCRTPQLAPDFESAASEDIQDLVDLLAIVPFNDLLHNEVLLLNPTFGETSRMVGGADADLIIGDMLVDIKTTKSDTIKSEYINQLLGYFLLARKERNSDKMFPVISRLGLYYSRYGYLYSFEASAWMEHPAFAETEEWFFTNIKQLNRDMRTHNV